VLVKSMHQPSEQWHAVEEERTIVIDKGQVVGGASYEPLGLRAHHRGDHRVVTAPTTCWRQILDGELHSVRPRQQLVAFARVKRAELEDDGRQRGSLCQFGARADN